ncbi:MAG: hypothetical protein A2X86_13595 [Bdellovibrionales bacterium GWA2_49_15]|nr:MAG: hypothetical protein A2X86_13595 [Bdellovibrionales bacterium GWA2_49_15]HAZ13560.1 hypothetical protein [Bdellovibrionales bacterium]
MKNIFFLVSLILWSSRLWSVDVGEFDFTGCGVYHVIGFIRPVIDTNQEKGKVIDYVLETYPPEQPTKTERHRKARTLMFKDSSRQALMELDLFHDMIVEAEIQLLSHSKVSNNVILKKIQGVSTYLASNDPARAVRLIKASPCN